MPLPHEAACGSFCKSTAKTFQWPHRWFTIRLHDLMAISSLIVSSYQRLLQQHIRESIETWYTDRIVQWALLLRWWCPEFERWPHAPLARPRGTRHAVAPHQHEDAVLGGHLGKARKDVEVERGRFMLKRAGRAAEECVVSFHVMVIEDALVIKLRRGGDSHSIIRICGGSNQQH